MEPICYLRTKDGKPDWAEDCVNISREHVLDGYLDDDAEGRYDAIPLYAAIPELLEVLVEVARLWPSVKDAPADVVLARCEAISASVATVLYQIHEETAGRTESADSGSSPPPTTSGVAGITAVTGGERPAFTQDAFNRLSALHGEMFKIACELFQMQKNGERLAERGLSEYERLIYGEGRPVPPHVTGPASYYPPPVPCPRCNPIGEFNGRADCENCNGIGLVPAETQPCFMCMGHGVVVSGHASAPKMKECSHCHGSGRVAKQQSSEGKENG